MRSTVAHGHHARGSSRSGKQQSARAPPSHTVPGSGTKAVGPVRKRDLTLGTVIRDALFGAGAGVAAGVVGIAWMAMRDIAVLQESSFVLPAAVLLWCAAMGALIGAVIAVRRRVD